MLSVLECNSLESLYNSNLFADDVEQCTVSGADSSILDETLWVVKMNSVVEMEVLTF